MWAISKITITWLITTEGKLLRYHTLGKFFVNWSSEMKFVLTLVQFLKATELKNCFTCGLSPAFQKINEKPQVINDYEAGRAIPNQQILGKLERTLGKRHSSGLEETLKLNGCMKYNCVM